VFDGGVVAEHAAHDFEAAMLGKEQQRIRLEAACRTEMLVDAAQAFGCTAGWALSRRPVSSSRETISMVGTDSSISSRTMAEKVLAASPRDRLKASVRASISSSENVLTALLQQGEDVCNDRLANGFPEKAHTEGGSPALNGFLGVGRKEGQLHPGMTEAQPFRQFDAGHAGHVHVEHRQIGMGVVEQGECGSPISRFEQMKPGVQAAHDRGTQHARGATVINKQNRGGLGHGWIPVTS
jgi:hypothetical protein